MFFRSVGSDVNTGPVRSGLRSQIGLALISVRIGSPIFKIDTTPKNTSLIPTRIKGTFAKVPFIGCEVGNKLRIGDHRGAGLRDKFFDVFFDGAKIFSTARTFLKN